MRYITGLLFNEITRQTNFKSPEVKSQFKDSYNIKYTKYCQTTKYTNKRVYQ